MEPFRAQETSAVIALSGLIVWQIRDRLPLIVSIAWAYFLISAARVAPIERLTQVTEAASQVTRKTIHVGHSSATALLLLLLVPLVGIFASRRQRIGFLAVLIAALTANFFSLLLTKQHVGLFDCSSFDAGVMAAVLPIAVAPFILRSEINWQIAGLGVVGLLVPLGAAIVTQSTTPVYLLVAFAGLLTFFEASKRVRFILASVAGALFIFGVFFVDRGMFDTNGRTAGWIFFMKWWREHGNLWVGTGGGTFEYMGSLIQMSEPGFSLTDGGGGWMWLHNDWLQILFEYGVTGLALATAVFAAALYHARRRPWVFCGLVLYGLLAGAQFPTHWVITQLWAVFLLTEAFASQTHEDAPG